MIEPSRLMLLGMLQNKGYATACFGKWHIGMTFFDSQGKAINQNGLAAVKRPADGVLREENNGLAGKSNVRHKS